jgi:hypothetical protein
VVKTIRAYLYEGGIFVSQGMSQKIVTL